MNENKKSTIGLSSDHKPFLNLFIFNWKKAWAQDIFRRYLILTLILIFVVLFGVSKFLVFIENRSGSILEDPVLNLLPAYDLSNSIFSILYVSIITSLIYLSVRPWQLIITIQAYLAMVIIRMIGIYLVPLEPPADYITLIDPVIDYFVYQGNLINNDLFFSGHVATLCLLYYSINHTWLKRFLLIAAITLSILMLLQHGHYTIDIIIAPLGAWIGFKIILRWWRLYFNEHQDTPDFLSSRR